VCVVICNVCHCSDIVVYVIVVYVIVVYVIVVL